VTITGLHHDISADCQPWIARNRYTSTGRESIDPDRVRDLPRNGPGCIRRTRAGIEGRRISLLQRVYGLDRYPNHGEDGLARWIGWGIVIANLKQIARTLAESATAQPAAQPAKAARTNQLGRSPLSLSAATAQSVQ